MELLDAIFEFNIDCWGGRYNPIIPIVDNQISDGYWNLLKFSDPDIIYSYAKLEESLIKRVDREISPFHFLYHHDYRTIHGDKPIYTVGINGQIRTRSLYETLNEKFSGPSEYPLLLIYQNKNRDDNFRYIKMNFGTIDDSIISNSIPPEVKTLRISEHYNLSQMLRTIAGGIGTITPIQLSEISADFYEPEYSPGNDYFVVVIGDNVWDWLYFWNRNIILPGWRRKRISQICASSSDFASEEQKNNLRKFWNSGQNVPTVLFISNEITEEELKKLGEEVTKKIGFYKTQVLDTNTFPTFEVKYRNFDFPKLTKHFQLIGQRSIFQNVRPQFLEKEFSDGRWMIDLKIDYRPERFSYTNQAYWWRLPKHLGIPKLFIKSYPGRITNSGMISIDVCEKEEYLELTIPDDRSVIHSYLIGYKSPCYTNDVRTDYLQGINRLNIKKDLRISDKGGYTRGVMRLFPSLWHTSEFIGNRYWRTVLETLCNINPETKEKAIGPIINKVDKIAHTFCHQLQSGSDKPKRWLAEYILKMAREQRIIKAQILFDELLKMLDKEREEFKKTNQNPEQFDVSPERNREDLIESLSELVNIGIFEQGLKITCRFCGSSFWYSIEEFKKEILCQGCLTPNQVPVETKWVYKLNELLKNAISFHGVFPMIWALGELLSWARDSFIYLPSFGLYENYEDTSPYAEVDIACILDGKLIIGEIKSSSHEFTKKELDKFVAICKEVLPHKVVIGAFWDSKDDMNKLGQCLEKDLKPFGIEVRVITPHSQIFEPEYHI